MSGYEISGAEGLTIGRVVDDFIDAAKDEWLDDEMSNRIMGFGKGANGRVQARQGLVDLLKREQDSDGEFGLVGVYLDEEPAGFVTLELNQGHKTVNLTIFIEPKLRRQGYGSALLNYFLDQLYNSGIYRVQGDVLRLNKAGLAFARENGFTWESTRKSAYWMDNDVFDIAHVRMLRPKWAEKNEEE